jgi:glycosyltransferase involved in cell wall biosynthesis
MRILLVHQYFLEDDDSGGSRWNEISKLWAEHGHEIVVIGGMIHANGNSKREEYKGHYFVKKQQGKVKVIRCHVSESYNNGFVGRLWGYFSFMFSSLLAGLLKSKGNFNVVIVTSPPLFVGFSGYLISLVKRIPLVFEVRDLWPESAIDTGVLANKAIIRLAYAFENFIYRKSQLINVLTPAFYNILKDHKNVPSSKLIMIPNAADFSLSENLLRSFDRESFREENGLNGKFVITYVGAHGLANHLDQVLDTAKLLEDTNVLFLLIGQGMEKARLIKMASNMKLSNVRFIDPVPKAEVFKYIIASEMGTSVLKKVDTFKTVYSNKTFDYMSCKKPILMAIDGVSRELIVNSLAGTYVEPENPSRFNAIIREYLLHPERLKAEGDNGYYYAKENFDREILAKRYFDRIESVIS